MPISQHSHSGQFCRHGSGTLEGVVQAAVARGFTTYALTEHVPRFEPAHMYPEESDMTVSDLAAQFDGFIAEAKRLRTAYAGQIDLVVGCETEYLSASDAAQMLATINAAGTALGRPLLVVGSVHHVARIPIDFSRDLYDSAVAHFGGDRAALYAAYFDAQYELLRLVRPHVVGHVDLVAIFAPSAADHVATLRTPEVWSRVQRNVKAAVECGALFEINSRAWKKGVAGYPCLELARAMREAGARFTLSDDAHAPEDVGMHYAAHVTEYVRELGLEKVYCWDGELAVRELRVGGPEWTAFFARVE
ncbi:hypothetical protein H9P43_004080 [Blastocladiella emersonii ATCC 22665]|nr:hypothetical protein H9P43_004080 [Blastocladiella emersonii ATCC 22665]